MAIKNLVESPNKIISAINIHWRENSQINSSLISKINRTNFEQKSWIFLENNFGNFKNYHDFFVGGDCSLWMFKKKQIFVMSVNLDNQKDSENSSLQNFVKKIELEKEIIDEFIKLSHPKIELENIGFENKKFEDVERNGSESSIKFFPYILILRNVCLLDLYGLVLELKYFSKSFENNFKKMTISIENNEIENDLKMDKENMIISGSKIINLNKFNDAKIILWFQKNVDFEFELTIKKEKLILLKKEIETQKLLIYDFFQFSLLIILCLFCVFCNKWRRQKQREKEVIIEIVNSQILNN